MKLKSLSIAIISILALSGCVKKGSNPVDPFEPINRSIHDFNMAFDATMLKPPAKFYKATIPAPVRASINNAYNNVHMLPTVANDLLQAEFKQAIRDSWRFGINSTLGVAGFFEVAEGMGLPPHSNDLGLTLAKWGDKNSPYIVIPFLGPATIRDGMGVMFDYALFTPYPYIENDAVLYGLLGLRYIDLRSQLLDNERLLAEALDPYSFIRDAYLQHRNYLINGGAKATDVSNLYVDDEEVGDYIDDESETVPSAKPPIPMRAEKHVTPGSVSTGNTA